MALLTVDDLARDLKVKNEDLVRELVTMGFEVDGPESPLETDDPDALMAQLVTALPRREVIEKRIKPTVIRRRVKKKSAADAAAKHDRAAVEAPPPQPPKPAVPEPPAEPDREPAVEAVEETPAKEQDSPKVKAITKKSPKKAKKVQAARIIEKAPAPQEIAAKPDQDETPPETPAVQPSPVTVAEVPVQAADSTASAQAAAAPGAPPQPEPEARPAEPVAAEPAETVKTQPPGEGEPVPDTQAAAPPQKPVRKDESETSEVPSEAGPSEGEPEAAKALDADKKPMEPKPAKKKKKKERKIQPAQIIGKVDLKKEPPKERWQPEQQQRPERRERPAPPPRREGPPPPRREGPPPQQRPAPPPRSAEPPGHAGPPMPPPLPGDEEKRARRKKEKKAKERVPDQLVDDGAKVRRRKEVLLKGDLYDERNRHGRRRGKGKKAKQRKPEITTPKASKRRLKIADKITVSSLAHKMSVKATEVIQHLLTLGVTATMNEIVDYDTASIVASEFGFEVESSEHQEQDFLPKEVAEKTEDLVARPPVITMMGHVDHGKTSLLDHIRKTHVTDGEAGGITQHIGAYKAKLQKGEVVFLDTPGHEAFTAMRARGAQVTDFVVLVVAADDGVMDQTREAINHARAAGVPIVVAVNKIDKPEADKDRVIRELSELNLIPEAWGGDTLYAFVSAKTGEGISELMDLLLLQAEVMELKANAKKAAVGTVIEARLDKGRGPVATVLVREGTIRLGDAFVAGVHHGKVRGMIDHEGRRMEEAGPAIPVEIQGFSGVPEAGEVLLTVDQEKIAKQIGTHRQQKEREKDALTPTGPATLDELLARMQEQQVSKDINLILKADVQGSVEALQEALLALSAEEVKVKVIHSGVGTVTESDVMLASASEAMIIGFNVRPYPKTLQLAEEKNIDIRFYTVIYEAIEDVRKAMEGMLAPLEKENVVGHAEVRQTFSISRIGTVAGCYVTSGKIHRSDFVRLIRDGVPVFNGKMAAIKRFKDDAKEVAEGYECGITLLNYSDIKVGDIIEAYTIEQEAAKLSS